MKWKREKSKLHLFMTFILIFTLAVSSLAVMAETTDSDVQINAADSLQQDFVTQEPLLEELKVEEPLLEGPKGEAPAEQPKMEEPILEMPKEEVAVGEPKSEKPVLEESKEEPIAEPPKDEPKVIEEIEAEVTEAEKSAELIGEEDAVNPEIFVKSTSTMGIMAIAPDTSPYVLDPNFDLIELGFSSSNAKSIPRFIWMKGGLLYMAIQAERLPDPTDTIKINGISADGYTAYQSQASIIVDGQSLPTGKGNDEERWVVAYWEYNEAFYSKWKESNTVYYNSTHGGGHDVLGGEFTVLIPKVSATLNKTWDKGVANSVVINIYSSNNDGVNWSESPVKVVTLSPIAVGDGTSKATAQIADLPYTDNTGKTLVYKAEEADPGSNYASELTSSYNAATKHYTFNVTNTYQPDLIIQKQVTGNFGDLSREFNFTVTIDGVEVDPFSLSHNESKVFQNISDDAEVMLTEDSGDYKVTVMVGETEIKPNENGSYTIILTGDDITITVSNHKDVVIGTGIALDSLPYILILVFAVVGLGLVVIRKRNIHN